MSRALGKIGLGLSALVIAVFLGEVVVRATGLAPAMLRLNVHGRESAFRISDNPVLGYEMKADFVPQGADTGASFRTNSHGQRDIERSHQKSGPRILLLGDSVVQGIRTPDLDDTISRQLEALLAPRGIEVLNFGVSGYNTRSEAELFHLKGRAFDPDLVILLFVSNDHWGDAGPPMKELSYERPPVVNWLIDHSQFFRAVAAHWRLFRFGQESGARQAYRAAQGDSPMHEGLRRLQVSTEAQGSRLLVALWPSFGERQLYYQPFLFPESDPETMVIERYAARLGLDTLRLDGVFERDLAEQEPSGSVIARYTGDPQLKDPRGDGMHPNARASRLAAEALADYLEAHPELLSSPR